MKLLYLTLERGRPGCTLLPGHSGADRKARWLLDHPEERQRLRAAVHRRITSGGHTYRDRLCSILACSALTTDSEVERSHARMGTDQ